MKYTKYKILGWFILLAIWFIISNLGIINPRVLPTPQRTLDGLITMYSKDNLITNLFFSIKINLGGYLIAIITSIISGFILGLSAKIRNMFSEQINAFRFIPITALMGVFIAISGLTIWTKINFLAFGIWVYLVPVVVQRIDEVSKVHLQMMQTLGATKWQTFRYVTWPFVISRLSDDIRILVGISWTYIIVAELAGMTYGVGSLIFLGEKQSNSGKVYAVILIIIAFGMLQDALLKWIDKTLFKFKY